MIPKRKSPLRDRCGQQRDLKMSDIAIQMHWQRNEPGGGAARRSAPITAAIAVCLRQRALTPTGEEEPLLFRPTQIVAMG